MSRAIVPRERWYALLLNRQGEEHPGFEYLGMSPFFARAFSNPLWSPYRSIAAQMLRESLPPPGGGTPPPWYGDFHLPPGGNDPPPRKFRRGIIGLLGAMFISSLWWYPVVSRIISAQNLTAPIGKRLFVRMNDGSIFVLKPDSTLVIWHDRQKLRLELRKGDVLCDLARNRYRQFELYVGDVRIVDAGTIFSVSKTTSGIDVVVKEGAVRVSGPHLAQTSLAHDQRARVDDRAQYSTVDDVSPEEVARRMAWRDGYLVFQQEKLSEVVHELNRYNAHIKIRVTDPAIADLPITFLVRDPSDLTGFLKRLPQLMPNVASVDVPASGGISTYELRRIH